MVPQAAVAPQSMAFPPAPKASAEPGNMAANAPAIVASPFRVEQAMVAAADGSLVCPAPPRLPRSDPGRDGHLPEHHGPNVRRGLRMLGDFRAQFQQQRYVFAKSEEMECMMRLFGATGAGLAELRGVCSNLNPDPYLPFRETALYRLVLDFTKRTAHRAVREPFVLTPQDGFNPQRKAVRPDTGVNRFFGEPQQWMLENSALQALVRWKAYMMESVVTEPRPGCDPTRNVNQAGFLIRTRTTQDVMGEPAAEGVHEDGVEFTMTTIFHHQNMRRDSARSTLYTMEAESGVQADEVDPTTALQTVQHWEFLDTLLFVDNEFKHTVTPVFQEDKSQPAVRDMALFHTRRMARPGGGFSADGWDCEEMHGSLPFAMALDSPFLAR